MSLVKSLGGTEEEVFASSSLVDLGLDSFTSLELVSRLQVMEGGREGLA